MTIDAGDIVRTTVGFTLDDGTIAQNIYHHQRTGIAFIGDQDIVDTLEEFVEAAMLTLITAISDTVIPNLCSVDKVEFVEGAWTVTENVGVFTPTFVPTAASDALPNQSSPYVLFKTTRPKSVGRKFLIPFTEAMQVGSFLVSGAVDLVVDYADVALTDLTIEPLNYLVPGIVRTDSDTFLGFLLAVVTNVLGSQRRRRPGVGA